MQKQSKGRKRVYLGLGHKRGGLSSWFSPFFISPVSKWVSPYLYWAYRDAHNTMTADKIFFSSGRLSDATGFRFCKAAGIRTGKGVHLGIRDRCEVRAECVWDPISQHNLLGGQPFSTV